MINSILTNTTKLTSGRTHWLIQRITAILLIPLTYPLVRFLSLYSNAPYEQTVAWIKSPINLIYLMLWVFTVFYHAALGLQVVIEDYVGNRTLQSTLVKLINWSYLGLGLVALVFIYRAI